MSITAWKQILKINGKRPAFILPIGTTEHVKLLWNVLQKYRGRCRIAEMKCKELEQQNRDLIERLARAEDK